MDLNTIFVFQFMCSTVDLASCMAAEYNITPDRVDICLISNLTSNYSLGTLQGFCDSPLPNCNFPEVLLEKNGFQRSVWKKAIKPV